MNFCPFPVPRQFCRGLLRFRTEKADGFSAALQETAGALPNREEKENYGKSLKKQGFVHKFVRENG